MPKRRGKADKTFLGIFCTGEGERQIFGTGGIEFGVLLPDLIKGQPVPFTRMHFPKIIHNGDGFADGLCGLNSPD